MDKKRKSVYDFLFLYLQVIYIYCHIFNCLNLIENYIIKNDTIKASEYLNNFGRLVRLILNNSRSNYVNLKDELEALELYIKMEQMRLRNSFEYIFEIEGELTIFGMTKKLRVPFAFNLDDDIVYIQAEFELSREDFRLSFGRLMDAMVGDQISVRVRIVARAQA